jgi:hypothetical protein
MLARPPGCTYHCGSMTTGQPGRLLHATLGWLPAPRCGIATCPNRVTDTVGLAPTGLWPCRLLPAPVPRIGTLTLVGPPLEFLPSHRDDRFPGSMQKPGSGSRPLYAGRHPGSKQVSPGLFLGSR